MKAVVCQNAELTVKNLPEPIPGQGQVLVEVLRCGICGSDLHQRHAADHMHALFSNSRLGEKFPAAKDPVVFGHEFSGQILEYGPGCRKRLKPGTRIVAPPTIREGRSYETIGLSKKHAGAYAERMILDEFTLLPVPNGLSSDIAALTEPMAVALHAVNISEVKSRDVAVVIGCGPIGLAVIAALKAKGVKTVIASDFSPGRRRFATQCGADIVVNPAIESPFSRSAEHGFYDDLQDLIDFGIGTYEKLAKLPLPWWHLWRFGEWVGMKPKSPVIFECVGVPGILQGIIKQAPVWSRIVVIGACMEPDTFEPAMALPKEINIKFSIGWTPLEFRDALHLLADGKLKCAGMVTGVVGLDGVANAFDALANPELHAKILIDPKSPAITPVEIHRR
ncbi:MAG: zinc-binding dehydrogenase [Alcanivoracaceae bacterium]